MTAREGHMTIQTQHFISLADIAALRCECKNKDCKTTLLIPLDQTSGQDSSLISRQNKVLQKCPNCGEAWAGVGNIGGFEDDIKQAIHSLNKLKELQKHIGFSLTLEIKVDASFAVLPVPR
jgi:hypothetical protein